MTKIKPRSDQRKTINKIVKGFETSSRGRAFLPTGYGKSLTGMWAHEKLGGKRLAAFVPSIQLVSQLAGDYAEHGKYRKLILVCSDKKAGQVARSKNSDIEIVVTTCPLEIASELATNKKLALVATYASVEKVSKAFEVRKRLHHFDLMIYDEAHRTAGEASSRKLIALGKDDVKAKRRLFMTATPRVFADFLRGDERALCMNDDSRFGPLFVEVTFEDAISKGLLSDYKIVVSLVGKANVMRDMRQRGLDVDEDSVARYASEAALLTAAHRYGFTKTIAFADGVENSKKLATGLLTQFQAMREDELIKGGIMTGHVDYKTKLGDRNKIIDAFRESKKRAVLSNPGLLGTGFDVKTIDSVAFIQPRTSAIEVAQRVGRALRTHPDKELAYIILPIMVDGFLGQNCDVEQIISETDFARAFSTINAMRMADTRIEATVNQFASTDAEDEDLVFPGDQPEARQRTGIVTVQGDFGEPVSTTVQNFASDDLPVISEGEEGTVLGDDRIEFFCASDVELPAPKLQHVARAVVCRVVGEPKVNRDVTIEQIRDLMLEHQDKHGKLPSCHTKELAPNGDRWDALDAAGQKGIRGLEKGQNLSWIKQHFGLVEDNTLTIEQIRDWMLDFRDKHGKLPSAGSKALAPDGDRWDALANAGYAGNRGLEKGQTLSWIKQHFGLVEDNALSIEQIRDWMLDFRDKHGKLPTQASKELAPNGDSWRAINAAGYAGIRGLEKGQSLPWIKKHFKLK